MKYIGVVLTELKVQRGILTVEYVGEDEGYLAMITDDEGEAIGASAMTFRGTIELLGERCREWVEKEKGDPR